MKIKPIEGQTYKNVRYNKNTIGIIDSIKPGEYNSEKIDYSTMTLVSIMYELGILKHELIKESFDEASAYIKEYEGGSL